MDVMRSPASFTSSQRRTRPGTRAFPTILRSLIWTFAERRGMFARRRVLSHVARPKYWPLTDRFAELLTSSVCHMLAFL